MEFVNEKKDLKVRQTSTSGYIWKTVRTGKSIELPESVGLAYGLTQKKATEGKAGEKKVETKQFDSAKKKEKPLERALRKIKRISKEIIEAILRIYKNETELVSALKVGESLPFDKTTEKNLKKHYGIKK